MSERYYVETDGQVYLVQHDARWTLPTDADGLPFDVDSHGRMVIQGEDVVYCTPQLDTHPHEWHHKDDVPGMDDAEPIVREAVHYTLPRVVAEAVIERRGQLLLVKPSRGFNAGFWTLPGGFVSYAESPAESVAREVREEVGVDCRIGDCLGVETFMGRASFYTWHMFFYRAELDSDEFDPPADEIEEVRWFAVDEAVDALRGVMERKLKSLLANGRL